MVEWINGPEVKYGDNSFLQPSCSKKISLFCFSHSRSLSLPFFIFLLSFNLLQVWVAWDPPWSLALGGALVGYVTNLVAIKSIFWPVQPQTVGPFTVQVDLCSLSCNPCHFFWTCVYSLPSEANDKGRGSELRIRFVTSCSATAVLRTSTARGTSANVFLSSLTLECFINLQTD